MVSEPVMPVEAEQAPSSEGSAPVMVGAPARGSVHCCNVGNRDKSKGNPQYQGMTVHPVVPTTSESLIQPTMHGEGQKLHRGVCCAGHRNVEGNSLSPESSHGDSEHRVVLAPVVCQDAARAMPMTPGSLIPVGAPTIVPGPATTSLVQTSTTTLMPATTTRVFTQSGDLGLAQNAQWVETQRLLPSGTTTNMLPETTTMTQQRQPCGMLVTTTEVRRVLSPAEIAAQAPAGAAFPRTFLPATQPEMLQQRMVMHLGQTSPVQQQLVPEPVVGDLRSEASRVSSHSSRKAAVEPVYRASPLCCNMGRTKSPAQAGFITEPPQAADNVSHMNSAPIETVSKEPEAPREEERIPRADGGAACCVFGAREKTRVVAERVGAQVEDVAASTHLSEGIDSQAGTIPDDVSDAAPAQVALRAANPLCCSSSRVLSQPVATSEAVKVTAQATSVEQTHEVVSLSTTGLPAAQVVTAQKRFACQIPHQAVDGKTTELPVGPQITPPYYPHQLVVPRYATEFTSGYHTSEAFDAGLTPVSDLPVAEMGAIAQPVTYATSAVHAAAFMSPMAVRVPNTCAAGDTGTRFVADDESQSTKVISHYVSVQQAAKEVLPEQVGYAAGVEAETPAVPLEVTTPPLVVGTTEAPAQPHVEAEVVAASQVEIAAEVSPTVEVATRDARPDSPKLHDLSPLSRAVVEQREMPASSERAEVIPIVAGKTAEGVTIVSGVVRMELPRSAAHMSATNTTVKPAAAAATTIPYETPGLMPVVQMSPEASAKTSQQRVGQTRIVATRLVSETRMDTGALRVSNMVPLQPTTATTRPLEVTSPHFTTVTTRPLEVASPHLTTVTTRPLEVASPHLATVTTRPLEVTSPHLTTVTTRPLEVTSPHFTTVSTRPVEAVCPRPVHITHSPVQAVGNSTAGVAVGSPFRVVEHPGPSKIDKHYVIHNQECPTLPHANLETIIMPPHVVVRTKGRHSRKDHEASAHEEPLAASQVEVKPKNQSRGWCGAPRVEGEVEVLGGDARPVAVTSQQVDEVATSSRQITENLIPQVSLRLSQPTVEQEGVVKVVPEVLHHVPVNMSPVEVRREMPRLRAAQEVEGVVSHEPIVENKGGVDHSTKKFCC